MNGLCAMTNVIRGLCNIHSAPKNAVVTMGNFDGMHIGHQALLQATIQKARALGTQSLVMLFEPQPYEFFAKNQAAARLTRWREKYCFLRAIGIDHVFVIRFNQSFAELPAEQFIENILIQTLQIKHIMLGDDFHFGHKRQGDYRLMQKYAEKAGFTAEQIPSVLLIGERVSSTRVRKALALADHALVERLLGRPYSMEGRVVYGDKRGRLMGFPTANIYLHRAIPPVQGVYIVRMQNIAEKSLPGVANVGIRPTIGGTRSLLEVHLFDFNQDIYGRHVKVEFVEKLRNEQRYPNLNLLIEQIAKDAKAARAYFEMHEEL